MFLYIGERFAKMQCNFVFSQDIANLSLIIRNISENNNQKPQKSFPKFTGNKGVKEEIPSRGLISNLCNIFSEEISHNVLQKLQNGTFFHFLEINCKILLLIYSYCNRIVLYFIIYIYIYIAEYFEEDSVGIIIKYLKKKEKKKEHT